MPHRTPSRWTVAAALIGALALSAPSAVAAPPGEGAGAAAGTGAQTAPSTRPVRAVQGRAVAVTLLTGDKVMVPEKRVPHFKPGKQLRERVDAMVGQPIIED